MVGEAGHWQGAGKGLPSSTDGVHQVLTGCKLPQWNLLKRRLLPSEDPTAAGRVLGLVLGTSVPQMPVVLLLCLLLTWGPFSEVK